MPALFGIKCGVCVCSAGDSIGMGVFGDESGLADPWEFRDIFIRRYKEGIAYCLGLGNGDEEANVLKIEGEDKD